MHISLHMSSTNIFNSMTSTFPYKYIKFISNKYLNISSTRLRTFYTITSISLQQRSRSDSLMTINEGQKHRQCKPSFNIPIQFSSAGIIKCEECEINTRGKCICWIIILV